ncbi:MAG: hypothetical protein QOG43_2460 [Actinomycetota bacterium]|jgi:hypothetical protein|nr:hypothetical protein [Actinomycetota bacterium]
MRFHPRRIALAFVLLLVTAPACSSDGGSSSSSEPSAATSTAPPAPTTTVAESSRVVLDDAGAQPRQALALRVAAGTRSQVAFESRIGLEMTIDGETVPTGALPATSLVLDEVIDKVDADGTAHYSVTFEKVTVVGGAGTDPEVVSQTQAGLSELEGLTGTGTFAPHGGGQTLSYDTASITNPTLRSTIASISSQVGNLSAPFPAEPVGVGARWSTTSTATINGITMNTTTQYTLRSRTGDRYELDFSQTADAPPGPADFPNLPAGTRASIISFKVQSTGQTAGDFTRHMPQTSTATGTGDGTFTITVGANQATLEQHLSMDATVSPA